MTHLLWQNTPALVNQEISQRGIQLDHKGSEGVSEKEAPLLTHVDRGLNIDIDHKVINTNQTLFLLGGNARGQGVDLVSTREPGASKN